MKIRLILLLIILSLFYSCEKEEENNPTEDLDTFLVIGDNNATVRILDTVLNFYIYYYGDGSMENKIDIDFNGINDVAFEISAYSKLGYFFSDFIFKCLNDKTKVLTNDSILSPEILDYGDTLNVDNNWVRENMEILSVDYASQVVGGDGIIHHYGNWYDLSNVYIGIIIENDENPVYGWIKLSISGGFTSSVTIHEIGYKKAAYNIEL
ncbi:MAG: hypothetical protein GQ564_09525 [Bacteroidales bacterium]|nr:hypothetical protein [Bacteroidales bacterium]